MKRKIKKGEGRKEREGEERTDREAHGKEMVKKKKKEEIETTFLTYFSPNIS